MTSLRVPWHLSPPIASGVRAPPPKKMADFSQKNMPTLGTWVTLVQGGTKGSKARRSNTQTTPALISAVSDSTVTVLYPNNLVLQHGFKGEPLKRVAGVAVGNLRRFTGSDVSLQILEKALLTAVKADACARVPTTPNRKAPRTPQRSSPRPESPSGESNSHGERARSRSRSPMRKEASSPKTPINRSLARRDTDEKLCASQVQAQHMDDEKACLSPKPCAATGVALELEWPKEQDKKVEMSPKSEGRRRAALTSAVSCEMRGSACGRLQREELEAALMERGFDSVEVAAGLQRLDGLNKILLMDGLVFLV